MNPAGTCGFGQVRARAEVSRVASICSSEFQLVPASRELSARHVNESAVMSVKRHRSWGSSSSLRSTMLSNSAHWVVLSYWMPSLGGIVALCRVQAHPATKKTTEAMAPFMAQEGRLSA